MLGAISLLWMPFWWVLFRNDPEASKRVNAAGITLISGESGTGRADPRARTANAGQTGWTKLLTDPTLLANYWAFFVFGYFLYAS